MTVKNEGKTVRGLYVSTNLEVGAEEVEVINNDENVFEVFNTMIDADHGAVITLQRGVLIWVDEEAMRKKKSLNLKLTLLAGCSIYGAAIMIGSEEDGDTTTLASLPEDMFSNLVGY